MSQVFNHTHTFAQSWVADGSLGDQVFENTTLGAGEAAGVSALDADGLKLTTNAAANAAYGITSTNLLDAAGFFTTSNSPLMEVDVLLPAALTAIYLNLGFMNADPANATGTGHWDNADTAHAFGFWFEKGAYSDALMTYYRSTNASVIADSDTDPAVSTIYRLKCYLGTNRKPMFYVNGNQAYASQVAMAASQNLYPYLLIIGNAKSFHVQRVRFSKIYS